MAAFLGNQLVKYLDGEWYHFVSKDHESCSIINCNTAYSCTNCLKVLVGGYTKNGMDWVKEIFLERCKKKIVKNSYNISKMWLQYNIGNLKDAVDIDGHVNRLGQ